MKIYNRYETESICPYCFRKLKAKREVDSDTVYLTKKCELHGSFRTKIWAGKDSFEKWSIPKIPIEKRFSMTLKEKGCPFDCGLCSDHLQHTCTAVLDVTGRCNLKCSFCFADSVSNKDEEDIPLEKVEALLKKVFEVSPDCNLQISGGEPTIRDDLPKIVEIAVNTGFKFVQINTNGVLLAKNNSLVKDLKKAGLSSVFLQFDGTDDKIYRRIRNAELFDLKRKAVENCINEGIGVILVPTIVPFVNDNAMGDIVKFALEYAPKIRGVHFQPVSYFGRIRKIPSDSDRITIPEMLEKLEDQTNGLISKTHFRPSSCEHSLCSFNTKYIIMEDGSLKPLSVKQDCFSEVRAEKGSSMAKDSVARNWCAPENIQPDLSFENMDGLDRFLLRAKTHIFSISGMAFQDVWNLDLDRLKGCCIHSVSMDGRLIPFCAYNVTNVEGEGLYRRK